ncbi:MAG: 2-dehydropantoate 2-reductase [Acidimicrobiales bacterium]|nr:2-dehydropantoate 2-reductase [Acidimicrobiales bacterium]
MVDGTEPRSVAVVGVGAIGGLVAVALDAESPHKVLLCARKPIDGLAVQRPDGRVLRTYPVVMTDPRFVEPCDVVLLATKAYQSEGAKPWLDKAVGPDTVVAVLQNGIDQVERVQPLVPGAAVVPVVVMAAAERVVPAFIQQNGNGLLELPDTDAGRRVAALFTGTGLRAEVVADFTARAWTKLLINAVVGAIGALTIRDLGVLAEPAIREQALALAAEVVAVGRAEGVAFAADAAERSLERALRGAPGHWSSISVDRREGRPLEWEVRNAVIGRLGRRHNVPTPLNDLVTALLAASSRA